MASAWKKFGRAIKNEAAKNPQRKHQKYFERKLTDIATRNSELAGKAKRLLPFVVARMRPTHQPYRSLVDLHKRIDKDTAAGDGSVIAGLEDIQKKFGDIRYRRIIRKPRILYSMMVDA